MPKDYIPSNDADLLAWGANFSSLISADPVSFGLSAAIATNLAGKQTAWANALEAATNPTTRGGSTVLAKDTQRADFVAYCRLLARAIQGTLTVTNQQRYDLGLTVRDTEPAPIPPPSASPGLDIIETVGNTVRIRLHDSTSTTRRGKPAGVAGAAIFAFAGPVAPTDEAGWVFQGNTTRTTFNVTFPPSTAPGSKVWLCAFWFNAKAQSGPSCMAVGVNLPGGASMAA